MAETFGSPLPFADPVWYSRGISPYYNESHRRLRADVRAYVDECIAPFCEQWEREGSIPEEVGLAICTCHLSFGYRLISGCKRSR
jgi:hypothetical protein